MKKVFSVGDNCVDPEFMIQGSSEPYREVDGMNDLISRQAAIDAISVYANRYKEYIGKPDDSEVYAHSRGLIVSIEMSINALPSAQPWDVVKTMLKELEQKEERLCSDYCDATARLKAINKIAKSSQKPNQKIDGIKPLAEVEVME